MPIIVRREPNFRCRVSKKDDQNGNKFWRLCYAEDEAKAEEFLNGERLVVHEVSAYDFEAEWSAKTKEEAEKAMAACQAGVAFQVGAGSRSVTVPPILGVDSVRSCPRIMRACSTKSSRDT